MGWLLMPHNKLGLSAQSVAELFPFHLLISTHSDRRLLSVGSAIKRLLPQDYLERSFDEFFCITRPSVEMLSQNLVERVGNKIFFISVVGSSATLRGQLIINGPDTTLFLGTLVVTHANSLDDSGFSLADFPPYDTTPEILILHRFREMQIKGMEQQNLKLQHIIEVRDTFDKFANSDELTGIANRRGFWAIGSKWLARYRESPTAVMILDLHRFKIINDNYGHDAGDYLLRETGRRLSEALQADGLPGRLGGDEFVVMFKADDLDQLRSRVPQIIKSISAPVTYNGIELNCHFSAGVVVADGKMDMEELIVCADLAIFNGRADNVSQIGWYTRAIREKSEYNQNLTRDLEAAIEQQLIQPYFQPVIRLSDGAIDSFEVLARWEHPEIGCIEPDVFIGLAQKAGLLRKLDALMLHSALDQLALWRSQGKDYSVHVNICGASIHPELPALVLANLEQRGLEPSMLNLELTETTLIDDSEASKAILTDLAERGVSLHLDDFGTGYSSLTHLQDFPVAGVKIDRSFVSEAPNSKRARNLLFAIADIASQLDLEMVGEGIETEEQLALLKSLGCHYGQGYLFGRPARPERCETLAFELPRAA